MGRPSHSRKIRTIAALIAVLLMTLGPVLTASGLRFGPNTPLTKADASYSGEASWDRSGSSVAVVGDVNGDGFDDIVVGGPGFDSFINNNRGKVYVIFGAKDLQKGTSLNSANASFIGENDQDHLGFSVAAAGDVNHDGYDDFIVGMNSTAIQQPNGRAYLFFGHPGAWVKDASVTNANVTFVGEAKGDKAGSTVAGVGDVNGDGYDDIAISAPSNGDKTAGAGQVYIVFGRETSWPGNINDLFELGGVNGTSNASMQGELSGDNLGITLAGAGDVDHDHYDDLLIGAPNADTTNENAGKVYLYFGKASGWKMDMDSSNADVLFQGKVNNQYVGTCIAGVGDFDHNMFDDIAICGKDDSGGNTNYVYKAFLFLSGSTDLSSPVSMGATNLTFNEGGPGNANGLTTISALGDVTGDGISDFILGDMSADAGQTDVGRAFLIKGTSNTGQKNLNVSSMAAESFYGEDLGDNAGNALGGDGDLDGDGYDDAVIGAMNNDGPGHKTDSGQTYMIFPDHNIGPGSVNSLGFCSDPTCAANIDHASINDTVYIELLGGSGNASKKDMALVKVHTSKADKIGMVIPLLESAVASGTYLGAIKLKNRTREADLWLKAIGNETLMAQSVNDSKVMASLFVLGNFRLRPAEDNTTAVEDKPYSYHYWAEGVPAIDMEWSSKTNASWPTWNATNHDLKGTPTNKDVGKFWVNVSIENKYGQKDSHNFTLSVKNVLPVIQGKITKGAKEHKPYSCNLTSTEDGQGRITWHLKTNGTWLKVNATTGQLYGTPEEPDVGAWWANVSVDDGNGGWDSINSTITVENVNDPPVIGTTALPNATEGHPYAFECNGSDPDRGDLVTWYMVTSAKGWLSIDASTGQLKGTPLEADVGSSEVNLTITEKAGLFARRNLTLIVVNVNEPPSITSSPDTNAIAGVEYRYDIKVEDPDAGETMTYSLAVHPDGMVVGGGSGIITWVPTNAQAGPNKVNIKVLDGELSTYQNYTVNVQVPSATVPLVTLKSPENGSMLNVTNPQLQWSAAGVGTGGLFFDVYLGKGAGLVRAMDPSTQVAADITLFAYFPAVPLDKGKTYYWTVIPNNGVNTGLCLNGVWNFTINQDAVVSKKPTVFLNQPVNGTILVTLPAQLTWTGADPEGRTLLYDLYISPQIDLVQTLSPVALTVKRLNVSNYMADGLMTDKMYYWTVVPDNGLAKGTCLSGVWSFKVSGNVIVNHAPVINSKPVTEVYVGDTYQYQLNATDPDKADKLSFSLSVRPVGMVIDDSLGLIIWIVKDKDLGDHKVVVRVSDGNLYVEQTYTLKVLPKSAKNNPPKIDSAPKDKATVGETYKYSLLASDSDAADTLNYTLEKAPAGMTVSKDGRITWTPKKQGKETVNVSVSDGKTKTYQEFVITVKAKPSVLSGSTGIFLLALLVIIICVIVAVVAAVMSRRSRARKKARTEKATVAKGPAAAAMTAPEAAVLVAPEAPLADEGVEDFSISEVFLIYNDGRLIAHSTVDENVGIDKQIMSGMLIAIQSFVKESFQTQQGLNSFEFGSKKVVLMGGKYVILAAVMDGPEPQVLRDEMQGIITNIETLYAGKVEHWDGNMETYKDAHAQMSPLFHLRSRLKIKAKAKRVRMKSGVEFYSGYVRLKVGVSNELDGPIGNINLDLAYDINTLRMSHIEPQYPMSENTIYLPDIQPGEKRTVAVYFDPLICQESHIDGKVVFTDASGSPGEAEMKRRPVDVVCPIFYTVETINVAMLKRLLGELSFNDSRIYEVKDPKALQEAHALAVASVKGHDVKVVREFLEEEPFQIETWFYGEAKESEEKLVIKVSSRSSGNMLEIYVASDNLASMTGLLAELGSEFRRKLDEKGIDRESLLLSTDDRMRQVLKDTALLLNKYAEPEADAGDKEQKG